MIARYGPKGEALSTELLHLLFTDFGLMLLHMWGDGLLIPYQIA
jgi:hypothetical protein